MGRCPDCGSEFCWYHEDVDSGFGCEPDRLEDDDDDWEDGDLDGDSLWRALHA